MKIHCAYDKLVPLAELRAHPKNRNAHPDDQIARLARIIEYQGIRHPIKVSNLSGFITSGHGRLAAAQKLGLEEFPVDYQDYDNEAQEYADLQADNAIALWSELDVAGIQTDMAELGLGIDLDLLGIKNLELPEPEQLPGADEDEAPEPPAEPKSKRGDVYELGKHRLVCGDSTAVDDITKLMAGEKADMVFTDPPYNVAVVGGCKNPLNSNYQSGKSIENDKMGNEEFRQFLRDFYATAQMCSRPGAVIYVCHADLEGINFRSAMVESGWLLKQCLIWSKHAFVFGRSDYHWQHEPILYGWKEGAGHKFYGKRNQSTIWNFDRPGPSDKAHPTMKPVELVEKAIANSSLKGDIVLDLFGGSGTTMIAAEKSRRRAFLCEIDPRYCDVIVSRWEKYTGKTAQLVR